MKQHRCWVAAAPFASMVVTALTPPAEPPHVADADWVAQTADRVLAAMEETRSTWQMWHVRAEAQRHLRTVDMAAEQANMRGPARY
jgi:hypothetical protein